MNSPLSSPCPELRPRHRRAFSLVELMTAMAILTLLFAMLGSILNTMSRSWKEGQQRANNFTKARAMLDLLARDLQAGLFRPDLPAFTGTPPIIGFYTQRPGITGTTSTRDTSYVLYQLNITSTGSILQRGDIGYDWTAASSTTIAFNSSTPPAMPASHLRDTAPGIVDFKVLFLYADGTLTSTYTYTTSNPLSAIGVTLAVVDDQAQQQLIAAGKLVTLKSDLEHAITNTRSIKNDWDIYLQSGLNWKNYPKNLPAGLKIFERYVYLPSTKL